MRRSAVLQHIQHIASLGLPDGVAIPEIMAAIEHAVPAAYGTFYWTDRDGTTRDLYAPAAVLEQMAKNEIDFLTLDVRFEPTLHKIVALGRTVDNASALAEIFDFRRSVIVNEVMPAMSVAMGIDTVIRRDGEAKGVMYLNRHVGEPGFTHAERQFLAAVQPYLAHAIGPQAERDGFAMDPEAEREGLVTASLEGEILAMAGEAGPILAEIPEVRDAGRTRAIPGHARLPQALQPVLQALAETAAGRPAPPARLVLKRRWGEFRVRAYPVLSAHGEHSGIVSLILSHHLPREVMMLRRIFGLKLSPMERRVAFLVGEGKSPSEMAAVLGVGEQTLRTYLKTAYARTGSQGRSGLAALVRGE